MFGQAKPVVFCPFFLPPSFFVLVNGTTTPPPAAFFYLNTRFFFLGCETPFLFVCPPPPPPLPFSYVVLLWSTQHNCITSPVMTYWILPFNGFVTEGHCDYFISRTKRSFQMAQLCLQRLSWMPAYSMNCCVEKQHSSNDCLHVLIVQSTDDYIKGIIICCE